MITNFFYLKALSLFARGGGGGHGGGGGGFGGGGYGGGYYGGGGSSTNNTSIAGWILLAIFVIVIIVVMYFIKRQAINSKIVPNTLAKDAELTWPEGVNQAAVSKIFYGFQNDWSSFNINSIIGYTTKQYGYNVGLMMSALDTLGRKNVMENVELLSCRPISINSAGNQVPASFSVLISASATDSLIDKASGNVFYSDVSGFSEIWFFVVEANSWRLNDIKQTTESENVLHPAIQNFAQANGYFYSGEWGSLLLPTRGQLFNKASFARSAVNDHVIGRYKDSIIEFYSYLPDKQFSETYTIAQAVLLKSYGNIVVHRKSGLLNIKPKGLTQVTLEWPDFNKKYSVYASDLERATSFELLNPGYMVKLEELPFNVDIEVVDNIVYLHTKQALDDYSQMLNILYLAFHEMKI
ncbi:MAG: hypothetical protein NVS1B10_00960 [Candidatus Saccharimonadales bacterium]